MLPDTGQGLSAEQQLVAAILQRALVDAQNRRPDATSRHWRAEARRWWHGEATVRWWLDLVDMPHGVYARLLHAVEEPEDAVCGPLTVTAAPGDAAVAPPSGGRAP